jgi:hypothetical protein
LARKNTVQTITLPDGLLFATVSIVFCTFALLDRLHFLLAAALFVLCSTSLTPLFTKALQQLCRTFYAASKSADQAPAQWVPACLLNHLMRKAACAAVRRHPGAPQAKPAAMPAPANTDRRPQTVRGAA